ncbi:hypothetical protein ACJBUB_10700, partial [Streptococcus suis]
MARKIFTADFLNHAATLFDGERTLKAVADILGVHPDNLSKHLRANGIPFVVGKSSSRKLNNLPENK